MKPGIPRMNPNFGSMVAVFSAPRSSIRPVTARFGGAERRSQHMHIKYMFIVQRYGLMQAAARGVLHANVVCDRPSVGGSDPEGRGGKARGRSDRLGRCATRHSPPDARIDYFVKAAICSLNQPRSSFQPALSGESFTTRFMTVCPCRSAASALS
jgi:hypothetical protein